MSARAKISGIITDIFPAEIRGNFEKRVFWIKETDAERYPEHYSLELHQGDTVILDKFKTGEHVDVEVTIRGKKWVKEGKESIFNTLKAWQVKRHGETSRPPESAQNVNNQAPVADQIDDLPF